MPRLLLNILGLEVRFLPSHGHWIQRHSVAFLGSPSKYWCLNMLITTHCQEMFLGSGITLQGTTAPGSFWAEQVVTETELVFDTLSCIIYLSESGLISRSFPVFPFPCQHYLSSWPCSCSNSVLLPAFTQGNWTRYRHDSIPEVAFQYFITQNCLHQLPPKTRGKFMCVRGRKVR